MLIASNLVYVHMPKTGGTYVTDVLSRIHQFMGGDIVRVRAHAYTVTHIARRLSGNRKDLLDLQHRRSNKQWDPHGTLAQRPVLARRIPVITTVRNPFDRYVSQYRYGWWKRLAPDFLSRWPHLKKQYPSFPEMEFEEFLRFSNDCWRPKHIPIHATDGIGLQTVQFLYYYAPLLSFREINSGNASELALLTRQSLHRIRFIDTDVLSEELPRALYAAGYSAIVLDHIDFGTKVLPPGSSRQSEDKWRPYYTPATKSWVRERENFLFRLFPSWDT
jgi:hypothetical protein